MYAAAAMADAFVHEPTVVESDERCTIIDDLLSPTELALVWNYFQVQAFRRIDQMGLQGHWLLEDAEALRGPTVGYNHAWDAQFPTKSPIDYVIQGVIDAAEVIAPTVGAMGEAWEAFSAAASIYMRGTGLLWHRDRSARTGSFSFYAHPRWNVEWGGELLLGDRMDIPEELGVYFHKLRDTEVGAGEAWQSHLDNDDASELLMDPGLGRFVMPRPNRLVVIRAGTPHSVAKVRDAAGRNVRASVSGFFVRKDLSDSGTWD